MKTIEKTTMLEIIEDAFGKHSIDKIFLLPDIRKLVGYKVINTDHDKVETYYDRIHEWIVPYSRMMEEDDE